VQPKSACRSGFREKKTQNCPQHQLDHASYRATVGRANSKTTVTWAASATVTKCITENNEIWAHVMSF